MVRLKFIIKDGMLVLRISEKKERYYKSVRHLLIGQQNLKYWMREHERFSSHAPSCAKNNQILEDYKRVYTDLIIKYPDLSARQIAVFYKPNNKFHTLPQINKREHYISSIEAYLIMVIEQEKSKQGSSNYRVYEKLLNKCRKLVKDFSQLSFQSIDFEHCTQLANVFAQHIGYKATCRAFRNLLGKASKDYRVNFDLSQIRDFNFMRYYPKVYSNQRTKVPQVLSHSQIKQFLNANLEKITPQYRNRKHVELYYDFCVFMFYSFCSPCDVIKMKHSNILQDQILCYTRKKTMKIVQLPISTQLRNIIEKYKFNDNQEYIFPMMNDKNRTQSRESIYSGFLQNVNRWLKELAKSLNWNLELYTYIFRHT